MARLNKHGLTVSEERFVRAYHINGGNGYLAFVETRDTSNWQRNSIDVEAYKLVNSPQIGLRLEALADQEERARAIDRDYVIAKLDERQEQAQAAGAFGPSIKGLELLGKSVGLFQDGAHVQVNVTNVTAQALEGYSTDELDAILVHQRELTALPGAVFRNETAPEAVIEPMETVVNEDGNEALG